ncbi:hypothetical protein [Hamadaea sp.]|uniref:hypothetical protein n=1 Tax=Hamadaea sp. TaxID=2024425 RepID=UPI0025C6B520|nr:hypothetical protein [Hamadaea sp.]
MLKINKTVGRALAAAALAGAIFVIGLIALAGANHQPQQAWAQTVVQLHAGQAPTTAAAYKKEDQHCAANQGGGPYAGQDVWVFVIPGGYATGGDFVSITADFGPNGTVTKTAALDPGNFSNGGPDVSKAWIITPAGWTLFGASAVITGTADFINLTHTCPASASPSPSPSTSPSTSPSASMSPSTSPSPSMSPSSSPSPSKSPSMSPSASTSPSPSRSPIGSPRPSHSHGGYGGYGYDDEQDPDNQAPWNRYYIWH